MLCQCAEEDGLGRSVEAFTSHAGIVASRRSGAADPARWRVANPGKNGPRASMLKSPPVTFPQTTRIARGQYLTALPMAILRRTPEPFFPTIEGVMVRAGLAPPPPTVYMHATRLPCRWEPRAFRYHPYPRTTPLSQAMVEADNDDMFTYSVVRRVSENAAERRGTSEAVIVPTVHWDDVEEGNEDDDTEGSDVARLEQALQHITPSSGPVLRHRLSRMVIDLANAVIRKIHAARPVLRRSRSQL